MGVMHGGCVLAESDQYSDYLLRLLMYYKLTIKEVNLICDLIEEFFNAQKNHFSVVIAMKNSLVKKALFPNTVKRILFCSNLKKIK